MLDKTHDISRYDAVWTEAEPYFRVRKNDVHIPLSFACVQELLDEYPEADRDVCTLALMLHDIGWHVVDTEDIINKGFGGKNFLQSEVRYIHEAEGCRLAKEILGKTGWSDEVIAGVVEIIDGHDTRPNPHHLNDRIARDADKLWRFSVTGVSVACDWFKLTPGQYAKRLEDQKDNLETEAGVRMANETLAATRETLKLHLL